MWDKENRPYRVSTRFIAGMQERKVRNCKKGKMEIVRIEFQCDISLPGIKKILTCGY